MAAAYADSGTASDVAGNVNLTPTASATVGSDNTLICVVGHTNDATQAAATYTKPSGWTLVSTLQQTNMRQLIYQKDTVDGTEDGATFTWTITSGNATAGHTAIIHRFTGGAGALKATSSSQNVSTTPGDAAVTTTVANDLAINILTQATQVLGSAFTGESGGTWSLVHSYGTSAPRMMLHTSSIASPGTIDGGSTTIAGSAAWLSFGAALKTAVGASISVPVASISLAGETPVVAGGAAVLVPAASTTMAAVAPTVAAGAAVAVPAAAFTLESFAPGISAGSVTPPDTGGGTSAGNGGGSWFGDTDFRERQHLERQKPVAARAEQQEEADEDDSDAIALAHAEARQLRTAAEMEEALRVLAEKKRQEMNLVVALLLNSE